MAEGGGLETAGVATQLKREPLLGRRAGESGGYDMARWDIRQVDGRVRGAEAPRCGALYRQGIVHSRRREPNGVGQPIGQNAGILP